MQNGKFLNRCCFSYYLRRSGHGLAIGQSERSKCGILYQLKNGCNWEDLPCILASLLNRLLALQTVAKCRRVWATHEYFTWTSAWAGKKKPKWTTLIIIDSQAVKNTCNASVDSKGFCFYKSTNGIKRHLGVDTLGFPFFTHCTRANVSDDAGLLGWNAVKVWLRTLSELYLMQRPKSTFALSG